MFQVIWLDMLYLSKRSCRALEAAAITVHMSLYENADKDRKAQDERGHEILLENGLDKVVM